MSREPRNHRVLQCTWCDTKFVPRNRGCEKRFCSDRCRAALHRACRLWGLRELCKGVLTIDALREAARKPYTARGGSN